MEKRGDLRLLLGSKDEKEQYWNEAIDRANKKISPERV